VLAPAPGVEQAVTDLLGYRAPLSRQSQNPAEQERRSMAEAYYDQHGFDARFEWGEAGVRHLAPVSDVVVIVDVLSFSTALEVAVARGAIVFPYRWHDASAAECARDAGAALAVRRGATTPSQPFSLSPATLGALEPGRQLVLPSPNGATLTLVAADFGATVLAGSLRNRRAVARAAAALGRTVTVIAAGERWGRDEGSLRPAIEDLIGAGAILSALGTGSASPEARLAMAAFDAAAPHLRECLLECASGRELCELGFAEDVELAAELDVSDAVPLLRDGAYGRWQPSIDA
jgi:2-phosphosulfolactate phosphatase